MLASALHIHTLREYPADADVISHRIMARAGFIHKLGAGLYIYGPLMWRVLRKLEVILREELDAAGCQEVQVPIMQPMEVWERSGRWELYNANGTMLSVKDRRGAIYGLAPTAEEVMATYVGATVTSYRQLPLTLYQIHTKFRDEIRPRFGVMRGKEFLMKDAYSFDADEAGLDRSYEAMRQAYQRIFARAGLVAFGVDADPGDIGGSGSMEFMVAANSGEDAILIEPGTSYAANVEKAESRVAPGPSAGAEPRPAEEVSTPGAASMEALEALFVDIPLAQMLKTLLYEYTAGGGRDKAHLAVLIRGDQEVNEAKLRGHLAAVTLRLLAPEEIMQLTGAARGFAGPVNLPASFQVVADNTVRDMANMLCGCNRTDFHLKNANLGRDFPQPAFADLRTARAGEPGPTAGRPLELKRGIEVGHIFKLGTKYSAAMKETFSAASGKPTPFVMGCYGIGVSRVVAAAIEQNATEEGFCWPVPIAPFEVAVACLFMKKEASVELTRSIYESLRGAGIDALMDDRDLPAGAKLTDLEVLGIPYVIIAGRSYERDGTVEVRDRAAGSTSFIKAEDVAEQIASQVKKARAGLLAGEA